MIAGCLAELLDYSLHRSHAHKIDDALEWMKDEALAFAPVPEFGLDWDEEWKWPCVQTPRRILMHTIFAARHYANGLVGETGAERSNEWIPANLGAIADDSQALIAKLRETLDLLCERAASLSDADLLQPARETWDGTRMKGFVVMDGAILHTAWHLGQLAMLIGWYHAMEAGYQLAPPTGPPGEFPYPGERDWSDLLSGDTIPFSRGETGIVSPDNRKRVLLRVARCCFDESPSHAIRRVVAGMTADELAWRPFPEIEDPWICRAMWVLVLHTWSPKIVYIDHALGEGKLHYGKGDNDIAGCDWGETDPAKQLGALDRANEWLVDHVTRASEADLDRVSPLHTNTPLAAWEAVACMAQHDVWHAGQLSIMRDLYRGLWEKGVRDLSRAGGGS